MLHKTSEFTIYFGKALQAISLQEIQEQKTTTSLAHIAELIGADQFLFLRQNHGVDGKIVAKDETGYYVFKEPGDFVITQKKNYGIGIVTADCLPIVIYDHKNHASAIIHAGWKGLAADIFQIAIESMISNIGSSAEDLEIFLGPSARSCCYQVQQDFIQNFIKYPDYQQFLIQKNGKTFFDSKIFIRVIARTLGMKQEKLYTTYNVCTICNLLYCSYRREKNKALRQVTMISLHEAVF